MREIKPTNNHGSITLRFTYQGERYSLSGLGSWKSKAAVTRANAIAYHIYMDCLAGRFAGDPSVYLGEQVKVPKRKKKLSFIEIWDLWVESLDLEPHTKANHYEMVRVFLVKADQKFVVEQFIAARESLAASTWNLRKSYLKACYSWAINEGYLEAPNPFASLRASTVKSEYRVNPFTKDEVRMILAEIESKYPHYLPFITFLFSTGCRTGEAVGLKWKHINFENRTITIAESNSKRGSSRIQKETKTESTVVLPMNGELTGLFAFLLDYHRSGEYVFLSPTGKTINPDNFRNRIWKPVLGSLKLEYRPLYQTRHTVLSHIASEQGLLAAAAVAGHRDATMVTKHYAKFTGKVELPSLLT